MPPAGKSPASVATECPDPQVFFVREQESAEDKAAYDRTDFSAIVAVDRYLEMGLVWKVRNTVTRLSSPGKAVSLQVPLLDARKRADRQP